jgi:nitroreductase
MNLYDLLMKRRSVRVFKDQKFEPVIEQLLDVANNAPPEETSSLSIILVRNPGERN